MKHTHLIFLSLASICAGIVLFAWFHEYVVFRTPLNTHYHTPAHISKKTITMYFWHKNAWQTETREIMWSEDINTNLYHIVANWLATQYEEHVFEKKITLEAALSAPGSYDAYISFDRNPLDKQQSTFEKLMRIEGLLKTLRKPELPIQHIHLLVHHEPLQDPQLDFSKAWPIHGFLT